MLKAKSKIIEQIMSKMSGSRILDVPGNPIAKQLEKEQKEMRKQLLAAQEELAKLEADLKYNEGFLASVMKKLSNEKFVNGAPEAVVANERKKQADAEQKIKAIKEAIAALRS